MNRYAIKISYNGKNYNGWQEQRIGKTIQTTIEDCLEKIIGNRVKLYASGRTDAGVSALGQVAHFSTDSELPKSFVGYINSLLPEDIKILSLKKVYNDFHARFDVIKKSYIYNMYISNQSIPLYEETALRISPNTDIKVIKREMVSLLGKHDFSSFCASNTEVEDKVREIFSIKLSKKGQLLEFAISGNGFLYNMVRIIVGTLLEIGQNKKQNLKEIIDKKNRKYAGKTVSAKGLVLEKVEYKSLKL